MDIKYISEQSYKNGYTKGYEQGKKEAVAKNTITTNYDRIRNMSVEELARFLNELNYQTGCKIPTSCLARECNDCIKLWLESEVEGE